MRDLIEKLEKLNEGHMSDMAHEAEKDHEVQMARSDLYKAAKYAVSIHKMMKDISEMEGIDGWVASKITKASDYLGSVKHYLEGQMMQDVELAVVPVAGDMTDAMTMDDIEVAEGRMSMRQLASMDKDAARKIEAMVGDESKYADMGDYQEALYNAARKMGLVESKIDEGYEKMVANTLKDAGISHDGFKDGFLRIDQDDMKDARKAIKDADMDPPKMIAEDEEADDFKPHMMYDPKTGKGYKANKEQDHLDMKAKGYGHDKPDMDALLKALKKKLSDEGGAAGFDPLEKIAKDMGVDLTPAMLKGMAGISMHRDGDYILENSLDEKEDIIGDIIAKLPNMKMKSNKDVDTIGSIIAKLPKDDDTMSMPASKPSEPKMSMVTKQKAMNKMALPTSKPRSMAQDTTRDFSKTESKFSQWGKK